jgi:hypothetical protein
MTQNRDAAPNASLRETFFGDVPLSNWAMGKDGEPWTAFSTAATCLERGDRESAAQSLQSIVRREGLESRHYIQAWTALRALGVLPPPDEAKAVYGVVLDVPINAGFDTLAAYEDGAARYLNFSGAAIIWDAPDTRIHHHVATLLAAGQELVRRIGPWEGTRPPLTAGQARISLLTPIGLHFGQAPFEVLARDAMAAPLIKAATGLMQALMQVADASKKKP